MKKILLQIGKRIKDKRSLAGITVNDLAKKSGVNRLIIIDLENNNPKCNPTIDSVSKIFEVLDLELIVSESPGEIQPPAQGIVLQKSGFDLVPDKPVNLTFERSNNLILGNPDIDDFIESTKIITEQRAQQWQDKYSKIRKK